MAAHDKDKTSDDESPSSKAIQQVAEDAINEEYEFLDSKLDELNSALDFLEQKNDDIHQKLKELLQSNINIRQELQNEKNVSAENKSD